jgi:tetratricopeptide (TPR) repeat protein
VRIFALRICACLVVGLAWPGGPAGAQGDNTDNRTLCADPNPATRIRACSILIKNGQPTDVNTPVAYNNRGVAYDATGQQDLAIQDFDQAISLFPNYAIAYSNRGLAYENAGKLDPALADFSQALKLNPTYAGAFNNRCYVLALMAKFEDALSDCQKALALSPQDAKTLDSLGYVYLRLGQFHQAIESYDAALKIAPKLPESLYGRAVAKLKSGDNGGGQADQQAAISLDSSIATKMQAIGLYANR